MLGEIFPVDMWAIVPLTALTFIVLSDAIDSLAEHYAWLRLSRAGAYAVGVGMILVFFLIDSLLNDDQAALRGSSGSCWRLGSRPSSSTWQTPTRGPGSSGCARDRTRPTPW